MTSPNRRIAIQSPEAASEALRRLKDTTGLTWAEIASQPDYAGITPGNLSSIAAGREPKDAHVRAILHLPALALAPVCVTCGEVHTSRRCVKNDPLRVNRQPVIRRKVLEQGMTDIIDIVAAALDEGQVIFRREKVVKLVARALELRAQKEVPMGAVWFEGTLTPEQVNEFQYKYNEFIRKVGDK